MSYLIYKITNQKNNKVYIGLTTQGIQRRWSQHLEGVEQHKSKMAIHQAIREYGKENFKIEKITECDTFDKLRKTEIENIKFFRSNNPENGYNRSIGGEVGARKIRKGKRQTPKHILFKNKKRIFYYIWEMEKDNLTMDDLSLILSTPVGTLYRMLREEEKRSKKYNNQTIKWTKQK